MVGSHSRLMICPFRLLEHSQIFTDCVHLLKLHEPGNELRIVAELAVPSGSIDYCLVSVRHPVPRLTPGRPAQLRPAKAPDNGGKCVGK